MTLASNSFFHSLDAAHDSYQRARRVRLLTIIWPLSVLLDPIQCLTRQVELVEVESLLDPGHPGHVVLVHRKLESEHHPSATANPTSLCPAVRPMTLYMVASSI